MLETGTTAPDFTLPDQHGEEVTLSALRGRSVVLYFYPKANTPGCILQACGVRDRRADYEGAGAVVLGVSRDSVEKLAAFDAEHELGFPLLSDADHAVAEAYGVWVEKSMYGKRFMGVQRATYLIDPEGLVAHVVERARPETHDEVILAALGELAAT